MKSKALENFDERHAEIRLFRERALKISEELKDEILATEVNIRDLKQEESFATIERDLAIDDGMSRSTIYRRTKVLDKWSAKVQNAEDYHERCGDELRVWAKETIRRTAIAHCTAFESFLRELLIEHALIRPWTLEKVVKWKMKLSVKLDSVSETEIIEYLVDDPRINFQQFPDNKELKNNFVHIVGVFPLAQTYLENNVIDSSDEFTNVLIDVRMLFLIRHQIVHGVENLGDSFKKKLKRIEYSKKNFISRLNSAWLDEKSYHIEKPPPAAEILASYAIQQETFSIKLEEFGDSIQLDRSAYC
ncbi:MAG: hypothetical protein ACE5IR_22915 [bacterium]